MKKLLISSAAVALLLVGCNNMPSNNSGMKNDTVTVDGIRKAPLTNADSNLETFKYTQQAPIPGKVKLLKPSYVTAPPMIPHTIEGMTPIKYGHNECLSCHMPQPAKAMGIVSVPKDHLMDNFDKDKKLNRIAGSRYNCTQCHAPQANVDPMVENKFEALKKANAIK